MPIFQLNIPENIHIHIHTDNADAQGIAQIHATLLLIKTKLDNVMTKAEFIQSITDLKTEVTGIGVKVDALEAAINNAGDAIPQDVQDALADLKSGIDSLNVKADNTPVAVPTV